MSANTPRYVTCHCEYCNGGIEFDANDLKGVKTTTVECPHCHAETVIFVPLAAQTIEDSPSVGGLFYYKIDATEKGPYTFEQLRSMWNHGLITADTFYRGEHSSQWHPLSEQIERLSKNPGRRLDAFQTLLLRAVFALSLIAFFLPNASISLPLFGRVEVSAFDFLTPKRAPESDGAVMNPDATAVKPNIENVIGNNGFQFGKANFGAIICLLSALGILIHYLLTLVWGVLAFAFKKTFSGLTAIWLILALQFPVMFLIGAQIALNAIKTAAMTDANNGATDNSPGAAIGTALGTAMVNQVSIQPGAIMWILMLFALAGIGLPFLARKYSA